MTDLTVGTLDAGALVADMAGAARAAMQALARASAEQRRQALRAGALAMRGRTAALLAANAQDMAAAASKGLSAPMLDRLRLTPARLAAIADGLDQVADLPDRLGSELERWTRPNGMSIARVQVPLGVVGVIFESRPNVAADAGALCLKAGNAVILRGGSESLHSSTGLAQCLRDGLTEASLPADAVQIVPVTDRAVVGAMLRAAGQIDVIVPRGGKSLVARVQEEARVPVFAHLEGINHTYLDRAADLDMARAVTVNAKLRRTGICGATETVLIDRAGADRLAGPVLRDLLDGGCEVRVVPELLGLDARLRAADAADWSTEYLDAIVSVALVDGVAGAIDHIARYGSHHTDAIITDDLAAAAMFLERVDSAIVVHNASTQFADGGEFGFGAEIGISTGRMHARGPVGVEQLTTYKYVIHGSGQVRPV